MLPTTMVLSTRVAQEHEREPGGNPVEPRVHVDEVCHHGHIGRDDDLEIDDREIHLADKGDEKNRCGDERDQRVGAVIEQDQFCRPADIDHIVQQAIQCKEHDNDDDREIDGRDDLAVEQGEDGEGKYRE